MIAYNDFHFKTFLPKSQTLNKKQLNIMRKHYLADVLMLLHLFNISFKNPTATLATIPTLFIILIILIHSERN